jgi:amino acid adenylation domain-containing protein
MSAPKITHVHAATDLQVGMLLAGLSRPDDGLGIEQLEATLVGPLDHDELRRAWAAAIRRHAVLRTGFAWKSTSRPRQVVFETVPDHLQLLDWTDRSLEARRAALDELKAEDRRRGFDLRKPPLVRLTSIRWSKTSYILVWTHHHAILDGWSQLHLIDELLTDLAGGTGHAGSTASFGAFADRLAQTSSRAHRDYWRDALQHLPRPNTPAREKHPSGEPFGESNVTLEKGPIQALAARHGLTLGTVLFGALALSLVRYRGGRRVCVGVTTSLREGPSTTSSPLIGPAVQTLPHVVDPPADDSVASWLEVLQRRLAEHRMHAGLTASRVHEWLPHAPSGPLFDVVFALANYPWQLGPRDSPIQIEPGSITTSGGRVVGGQSWVVRTDGELHIHVVHDRRLVSDAQTTHLLDAVVGCLDDWSKRGLSAAPEVKGIVIAPPSEVTHSTAPSPRAGEPPSDLLTTVAGHVSAVLRRPIHAHETSFFEAGGHSLAAVELVARLRRAFRVEFTLVDVFDAPTVHAMSALIAARRRMSPPVASQQPLRCGPSDVGEAHAPFPLAPIQRAYWVGRQAGFELGNIGAHLYAEFDVEDLDVDALERVIQRLVQRHDMLRAITTAEGTQRVLADAPPFTVERIVLSENSERDGETLARLRHEKSHRVYRADRWPLFDVTVAILPGRATRVLMSADLLIGDAHSWMILCGEGSLLYVDPTVELAPIGTTYRDYVRHLSKLTSSPSHRRARNYWAARLPSLPPAPQLPRLHADHGARPRFVRRTMTLSAETSRLLGDLAASLDVTVSAFLLAVFADILVIYAESPLFTLNLTMFDRPDVHPDIGSVVGDFTSLLLLSVDAHGGTLADRARRLQRQLWEDMSHREVNGVELLRELASNRGARNAAPMPVVFTSTVDTAGDWADVLAPGSPRVRYRYGIGQTPQVDLDYQTYLVDKSLVINWDVVDNRFPDGLIDEMFSVHQRLLKALATGDAHPRHPTPAAAFRPKPRSDRPPPARSRPRLLHEGFWQQVAREGHRTAVIAGGQATTYDALAVRVRRVVAAILEADVDRGELVALRIAPGVDQLAAALGVLTAGCAYLPLDTRWPKERVLRVLRASSAAALVHHGEPPVDLYDVRTIDLGQLPTPCDHTRGADPKDRAYVIYTSGSTGDPKGVVVSHAAASNTLDAINDAFQVDARDRVLAISALSFDLSVYDVFGVLGVGGAVVVPPPGPPDPKVWADQVRRHEVTIWNTVPVCMELLMQHVGDRAPVMLSSLRLCMLSGDWIPVPLAKTIREHLTARLVSLGGATEGAIWSIMYEVEQVDPTWSSIPYGRALPGQHVTVRDDLLNERPDWVPGQLYIGGHGVALRYHADPHRTAESFVEDPSDGGRLYATGDWGRRRPDGVLEFLGRRDRQVKVAGHRIELAEIEVEMLRVPGVTAAVVVASAGPLNRRLAGYITGNVSEREVRDYLQQALPAYMVPQTLTILDEMPTTPTAKVDRAALRAAANQPHPEPTDDRSHAGVLALVHRFCPTPPSGPQADLVDAGMGSIEVIRFLHEVEASFGVRIALDAFYERPTVAAVVAALRVSSAPTVEPVRPSIWQLIPRDPDYVQPPQPLPPSDARRKHLLPPPAADPSSVLQRKSTRTFSEVPVPLQSLGDLLACLQPAPRDGILARRYPSAGGLYPVEVHVLARPGGVEGLATGLYRYLPHLHDLICYTRHVDLDEQIHLGPTNRPIHRQAAFALFMVVDVAAVCPKYGPAARELCYLDAGYMGQLLCTHAATLEIGLCPIAGVDFDRFSALFPDPDRQVLLHTLLGGLPMGPRTTPSPSRIEL